MSNLREGNTSVSDFQGDVVVRTGHPGDLGPAGLKAGDMYINETTKEEFIYDGTGWWGKSFTSTTSTSTSTSTTTS